MLVVEFSKPPKAWHGRLDGKLNGMSQRFCLVCATYTPENDPEGSLCPNRYTIPHDEIFGYLRVLFEIQMIVHNKFEYSMKDLEELASRARYMQTVNEPE